METAATAGGSGPATDVQKKLVADRLLFCCFATSRQKVQKLHVLFLGFFGGFVPKRLLFLCLVWS